MPPCAVGGRNCSWRMLVRLVPLSEQFCYSSVSYFPSHEPHAHDTRFSERRVTRVLTRPVRAHAREVEHSSCRPTPAPVAIPCVGPYESRSVVCTCKQMSNNLSTSTSVLRTYPDRNLANLSPDETRNHSN